MATSLTLALSPRRGNSLRPSADVAMTTRPTQSLVFAGDDEWFSFSPGEKAGMRESVKVVIYKFAKI